MGNNDLVIEARDLRRTFKQKVAVNDISFTVPRGTIYGLLGPNGAGKTTTIRMLSGQIAPDSGSATVAGCNVVNDLARLKQVIGVVFEDQNLYERLTGRQNLAFSCWLYGLPLRRADEVLDLVKLRDRGKDAVKAYSNGMRQRLMIARALLHKPAVLFLDEPSRGLDPISAREVRQSIEELSHEGMTILLTTHLMEEADQLCQRIGFIVNGQLVANDTPQRLKLAHGQRAITVTLGDDGGDLRDVNLHMDSAPDQQQLSRWMADGQVRAMHTREASLEDVFVEIAGIRPA